VSEPSSLGTRVVLAIEAWRDRGVRKAGEIGRGEVKEEVDCRAENRRSNGCRDPGRRARGVDNCEASRLLPGEDTIDPLREGLSSGIEAESARLSTSLLAGGDKVGELGISVSSSSAAFTLPYPWTIQDAVVITIGRSRPAEGLSNAPVAAGHVLLLLLFQLLCGTFMFCGSITLV